MRGTDLLRAIGHIDDELVEEASQTVKRTKNGNIYPEKFHDTYVTKKKMVHIPVSRIGSAAACLLCLCITGVVAYRIHQSEKTYEEIVEEAETEDLAVAAALSETTSLETADAISPQESSDALDADGVQELCSLLPETDNKTDVQSSKQDNIQESDSASRKDWSGYEIISEYPNGMEEGIYCYAVPAKGSYFYYHYLDEAIKHYETTDGIYAYDVCIDVFAYYDYAPDVSDETQSKGNIMGMLIDSGEAGKTLLEEEYQRLLTLGYDVKLSKDYKLNGIFTAYELEHFAAYEDYGYTFRFANEN